MKLFSTAVNKHIISNLILKSNAPLTLKYLVSEVFWLQLSDFCYLAHCNWLKLFCRQLVRCKYLTVIFVQPPKWDEIHSGVAFLYFSKSENALPEMSSPNCGLKFSNQWCGNCSAITALTSKLYIPRTYNLQYVNSVSEYKKRWSEMSIAVSYKIQISTPWPFLNSSSLSVGHFLNFSKNSRP